DMRIEVAAGEPGGRAAIRQVPPRPDSGRRSRRYWLVRARAAPMPVLRVLKRVHAPCQGEQAEAKQNGVDADQPDNGQGTRSRLSEHDQSEQHGQTSAN